MAISLWRHCEICHMNPETLRVIIAIVREFYEHEQRFPTAAEVQTQLHLVTR